MIKDFEKFLNENYTDKEIRNILLGYSGDIYEVKIKSSEKKESWYSDFIGEHVVVVDRIGQTDQWSKDYYKVVPKNLLKPLNIKGEYSIYKNIGIKDWESGIRWIKKSDCDKVGTIARKPEE